ncbi:MAG: prolyl oligopeptidase family serine peptidase [Candidatus Eisenbacteria bacterium]
MRRSVFPLFVTLSILFFAGCGGKGGAPKAPVRTVTDTYWGVGVKDDYRYMENQEDPAVRKWAEGQDEYTARRLEEFAAREALGNRVRALLGADSEDYQKVVTAEDRTFALKYQPPKQQASLVTLSSFAEDREENILIDPNEIDPTGGTRIDFFEPSPDGRFVAVSLSANGTEDGTLHVWDAVTGEKLAEEIPRVSGGTAGGSVAWTAGGGGLYYTRYPHPGERPDEELPFYQQIWHHRIGDPIDNDRYALGETFPKIAEIELVANDGGTAFIAKVSLGDGGEYEFWLLEGDGAWTKFARFEDGCQRASFGKDGSIYLLCRKDAPHKKLLVIPPGGRSVALARTAIAETGAVLTGFRVTENRIYAIEMVGGPSQVHIYDLRGNSLGYVALGEISTISSVTGLVGDDVLVRSESYTRPPGWYRYGPGMDIPERTDLVTTSAADFSGCDVVRRFAVADDGVNVPVDLIKRKETPLDGTAPAILYGYGSYGISQRPRFRDSRLLWLEQGGILAVASIRGGGEYGDEWHRAANLEKKKRSIDDFAACARFLVESGITSREKLVLEGGSAGGMLVYGTTVLYPEVAGAAVSYVGFGDVLRSEFAPNGEFNITEFGTVKDSVQFAGMYGYSPYHHVRKGVEYPAVMSLTGLNDPRVESWHPFKMTAALQASGTKNPVLLRIDEKSGHGGGSLEQQVARTTDVYSFIFMMTGTEYREVE